MTLSHVCVILEIWLVTSAVTAPVVGQFLHVGSVSDSDELAPEYSSPRNSPPQQ